MLTTVDLFKGYYSIRLSQKNKPTYCLLQSENWSMFRVESPADKFIGIKRCICLRNKQTLSGQTQIFLSFYYIDDIFISLNSLGEPLKHLNTLFATLRNNTLMINSSKTCACFDELEFLSHTVSSQGVRISEGKTKVIRKITAPTTKKSATITWPSPIFSKTHTKFQRSKL